MAPPEQTAPKLFISYSHDSREHEDMIRALADRLREDGIDTVIDQYDTAPPDGWPMWMEREIRKADFIALACTETYLKRVEGRETPGKGRGVLWEAKLIYSYLYAESSPVQRFIPLLFQDGTSSFVPRPLCDSTHYRVDTAEGYEGFYRHLTGQPAHVRPTLGKMKAFPPIAPQSYAASLEIRTERKPPSILDQRYRLLTLKRVRADWIDGFLNQSLYRVARIELGLQTKSDAIEQPLRAFVQTPDLPPAAIPSGTPISQIFDDHAGALLILGGPGTGKTTLLLELARDLLDRADKDESQPIPVVFNLSSWAVRRPPLGEWLVEELTERGDVPKRVAQQWVETEQIIPLLDGLDEVDIHHRQACTEAINGFRRDHGLLPIAVCSRITDYAALGTKLRLRNAVVVQPLTRSEVQGYLDRIGEPARALRTALEKDDPTVWELLRTPLMLWVYMLTYRDVPVDFSGTDTIEHLRHQLFTNFVEAMFKRRSAKTAYTPQQTILWLRNLAFVLKRTGQSSVYLESLSADWLLSRSQRWLWRLGVAVAVGLVGALISGGLAGVQLAIRHQHMQYGGLTFGLAMGLFLGLVGVCITSMIDLRPTETIRIRGLNLLPQAKAGRLRARRFGRKVGLFFGLIYSTVHFVGQRSAIDALSPHHSRVVWWLSFLFLVGIGALIVAWLSGLLFGLFGGVVAVIMALPGEAVGNRKRPNQGTHRSIAAALATGLVCGAIVGRILWLTGGPLPGLRVGVLFGLLSGLVVGGMFALNHLVLRLMIWMDRSAPLNLVGFLDFAVERLFLFRVSGGYMFMHKLLWEYFVSLEGVPTPDPDVVRAGKQKARFSKLTNIVHHMNLLRADLSSRLNRPAMILRSLHSRFRNIHAMRIICVFLGMTVLWLVVRKPEVVEYLVGYFDASLERYGQARQWYEKAAARGDADAMNELGILYHKGHGLVQDYRKTREWWEKSAAAGNANAMSNLGYLYDAGEGVAQDYGRARQWYEKAAARGIPRAMNNLGFLYEKGRGAMPDYNQARYWYEKAAAGGNVNAMSHLGGLYRDGHGVTQDYQKARQWYEKAAAEGNGDAMDNLGLLYERGQGLPQDYQKARDWYGKAAASGNLYAMSNLGGMYREGHGVAQDYQVARGWFEKAAAGGNADAMDNLGFLYEKGQGVARDYAKAGDWYRKALTLKTGDADAYNRLGYALAEAGRFDEAIPYIEKGLQLRPGDPDILDSLAFALAGKGQYRTAMANYERALHANPKIAVIHLHLAQALVKIGRRENAKQEFDKAYRLDPQLKTDPE